MTRHPPKDHDTPLAAGASSRNERIADLYTREAPKLQRNIARRVRTCPQTIEDACSFAWTQLIRRDDIDVERDDAIGWLYTVARHEAIRQVADAARKAPLGLADDHAIEEQIADPTELPALVEQRERIALVAELPQRQRRILLLLAYGYSYEEIAQITGDSWRTVDRQMRRAKSRVRVLDAGPIR